MALMNIDQKIDNDFQRTKYKDETNCQFDKSFI